MSIAVITWVMSDADVQNHGELAVLYALAERAHDDGRYAWPSQAWIAYRARCTTRTVRNHLAALEGRGVIRRGDQMVVGHLDPRYRPIVWDIDMTKVRSDPRPERLSSLAKSRAESFASRPENLDTQAGKSEHPDRKQVSYKPSIEPSSEPSKNLTLYSPPAVEPTGNGYPDAFERWWDDYPKKTGKRDAYRKWKAAKKRIGTEKLHNALRAHLPTLLSKDPQYVPNPATWLNQGRYDDPVADIQQPMSQTAKRQQSIIDAANQLFARELNHDRSAIS